MEIVENKIMDYLSVNVSEGETEWNIGSIYDYFDEVRDGHFIYQYAGEDETNTTLRPSEIYERDKDVYPVWVQVRPTNYWAALDDKTLTQTVKTVATNATTDASGYSIGETVITLASAGTGAIISGDIINFDGDTNDYEVSVGDDDVSDGGTITLSSGLLQAIPTSATDITVQNKLIMEFSNDAYDTIALLNLNAQSIHIELIDLTSSAILYDATYDLLNTQQIVDEKTYWYAPFEYMKNVYEPNIYMLTNTKIRVTISDSTAASVGRIVGGQSFFVGDTIFPATIDQVTYSRFKTDIFGNAELSQGNSVKNQSWQVKAPLDRIPYLEQKRVDLTAIPLLFVMDESENSKTNNSLLYGYFENAPFKATNNSTFGITVNLKGLI